MKRFFNVRESMVAILVMNMMILIMFLLFSAFISLTSVAYALLTIGLIFFLMSFTTKNYQNFKEKNFIERSELNQYGRNNLKLFLFLKSLLFGFLFVLTWLGWLWIFNALKIKNNLEIPVWSIIWKDFPFSYFFYFSLMEVMMIVLFTYVINHLIKQSTFIYGIIIMVAVYFLIFGSLLYEPLMPIIPEGETTNFLTWTNDKDINKILMIVNNVFFPWSIFDTYGKLILVNTNKLHNLSKDINWFNMSHMNERVNSTYGKYYETVPWISYVFSFTPIIAIEIHSKIIAKN